MGHVSWNQYRQLVDEKIADKWYNMLQAEKTYNQAKAEYDAAMREKQSFENAVKDMMDKAESQKGIFMDVYA